MTPDEKLDKSIELLDKAINILDKAYEAQRRADNPRYVYELQKIGSGPVQDTQSPNDWHNFGSKHKITGEDK